MTKNFSTVVNQTYKNGYKQGHRDATVIVMQLAHMAFCVALNQELGIGADRFEKVRQTADKLLGVDVVDDAELSIERLRREYERITGQDITDVIK